MRYVAKPNLSETVVDLIVQMVKLGKELSQAQAREKALREAAQRVVEQFAPVAKSSTIHDGLYLAVQDLTAALGGDR